jgi:F-box protein 11
MPRPPAAFLSYVHYDDEHEEGRITELLKRLEGEIRVQTGLKEFNIFQDRDICWGEQWQARIDSTLDAATFFIPILTPLFFRSDACRNELSKFLDRETALHRHDLILPIYYVNAPEFNDPIKRAGDSLARTLAARQYVDWRELRLEPWTDPRLGKLLARMAVQLRHAMERSNDPGSVEQETPSKSSPRGSNQPAAASERTEEPAATQPGRGPTLKIEPPTHIVDPLYRGNFTTISTAIATAKPGDRILVRPGLYQEGIWLTKPLEILGDGPLDEIVVTASGKAVINFHTTMGKVINLTLRQAGGDWHGYGVDIFQGRLELEGCDITSQSLACVVIHHGAEPHLRRNRIHDGTRVGVWVYNGGKGILEDNDIFANHSAGVEINGGASPTLRRNRIHDCKGGGVVVHNNGQGTLENNDIFANGSAGVEISRNGNPVLQGNRIAANASYAIWIHDGGGGTFRNNDLRGNTHGSWNISKDSERKVIRDENLTE